MKVVVLNIGEAIRQHPYVVIVDQRYGADHLGIRAFPGTLDQLVANEIAERLRTVRVPAAADEIVEFPEKLGVNGDADAAELSHAA
jgi:hypothetical protein